jgi:lipopolysaccharide export system protein LptA
MALGLAKNWTIERLRRAVVAVAAVLLLAILGSVIYGHWRLRHIAQDLPARLGVTIQQTTRGYVLSKTEQGRTVFTLHAARAVEFKSGKRVSLHDVEIDMYNQQGGAADTISGSDFEFDPRSEIVESRGETHIVLHSPPGATGRGLAGSSSAGQPIRITTNDLVFNQKTGIATCNGEVDFQVANSNGQAIGAVYDSKQSHLLLRSQVVLTTTMQNRPAVLHASEGIYDKSADQIHLRQPRYSSTLPNGTERGEARQATVYLRKDGSAERLDAQGDVRLVSADGTVVQSSALNATLGEKSQPQYMQFSGGVLFLQNQPEQQTDGSSQQAEVQFDAQGRAQSAMFDRAVRFQQVDQNEMHLRRTLRCDRLKLHLLPAIHGQAKLQTAQASGNAMFTSQSTTPQHAPLQTAVSAQMLNAKFGAGNQIRHMDGAGQTGIRTIAANGDIDTSTGDTLKIDFALPPPPGLKKSVAPAVSSTQPAGDRASSAEPGAQSIQTAVQTGHVVLTQIASAKKGAASQSSVSTANAARAEYIAANDTLTLTGTPAYHTDQMEITADEIEVKRATGDVTLSDDVQSTLRSGSQPGTAPAAAMLGGGNQPVHIIAQHAILLHRQQQAIFTGRARLWQGGDAVAAPVIELSQKMQTLTAYSAQPCGQCVVSNFISQTAATTQPPKVRLPSNDRTSTFRILSGRLLYSDAERKATFVGKVQVISASGELFADHAEMFLVPANHGSVNRVSSHSGGDIANVSSRKNNSGQSSIEKIVATGHVRWMQPGRRGTGTRLVYTANDGHFVLTGDAENPPQIFDADRGTVTGQVLTFTSPEQAIIVSGNTSKSTTTRTRVKKS